MLLLDPVLANLCCTLDRSLILDFCVRKLFTPNFTSPSSSSNDVKLAVISKKLQDLKQLPSDVERMIGQITGKSGLYLTGCFDLSTGVIFARKTTGRVLA